MDEAPDPRFDLANERTFLAYERTAVGLLIAAVGVIQFLRGSWVEHALGIALLVSAAATAAVGWQRHQQVAAAIRDGRPLPAGLGVPVVGLSILALTLLVGLSVLV